MSESEAVRDWISLKDALWWVLYGADPASGDRASPDEMEQFPPLPGAWLHGVTTAAIPTERRRLDEALSRAAASGIVRFAGRRSESPPSEPIPATDFVEVRGFDLATGTIRSEPFDLLRYRRRIHPDHGVLWRHVVADQKGIKRWMRLRGQEASPSGEMSLELSAKDEAEAVRIVTEALQKNADLRRDDAAKMVRSHVSDRGFLTRVWPQARERAGLCVKALPGRKKSKR